MAQSATTIPSHPADLIKELLKERRISQKDFAKLLGMRPSNLNDILNKRRSITDSFALEIEKWLGIPAKSIIVQQAAVKIVGSTPSIDNITAEGAQQAAIDLDVLNGFVNVNTLLKVLNLKLKTAAEKLKSLLEHYNLSPEFRVEYDRTADGCFRKSAKNGLDERMIATWMVLAKASVNNIRPSARFDYATKKEVCDKVCEILHNNKGSVIADLISVLDSYGIVLRRVEKVEKASIDGFSFFRDSDTPCIVITCRYDRIDNLAFTLMHELGHIYLKHTSPNQSRINIDTRSINDEVHNKIEEEADEFASEILIPSPYWNSAPPVPLNPYKIQLRYSEWAERLQLNKWIVLGHVSHSTGMYKFISDQTRRISGGKEVPV